MTKISKLILLALLATPLGACSTDEEPTGVIPQGHLDALDKANNVEHILKDAQKKQLEKLDNPG